MAIRPSSPQGVMEYTRPGRGAGCVGQQPCCTGTERSGLVAGVSRLSAPCLAPSGTSVRHLMVGKTLAIVFLPSTRQKLQVKDGMCVSKCALLQRWVWAWSECVRHVLEAWSPHGGIGVVQPKCEGWGRCPRRGKGSSCLVSQLLRDEVVTKVQDLPASCLSHLEISACHRCPG